MEIKLKKDWDFQPKLKKQKGHHTTRGKEHLVLIDFLTRRNEGSILVCGNRGVGKTSSVITAVNDVIGKQQKNQLIPILIKATSIDFKYEHILYQNNKNDSSKNTSKIIMNDEAKKPLLKSLIRFLNKEMQNSTYEKDENLKNKIEGLYEESLATEAYDINRTSKSMTNIQALKGFFRLPIQFLIGLAFTSIILHNQEWIQDWWILLILAITGSGISATFLREYRTRSTKFTSSYNKHSHDFSDLLSKFEDLLIEYSHKHTVLFILDEFDKIEYEFEHTIAHMKMLINQGNALFIFITSPDKIIKINDPDKLEYTMFSQILFLNRPLFEEMDAFIDDIVQINSDELDNSDYENFKNYLCFESKTDFFNIYNVIRDHINVKDGNDNPMIKFSFDDASLRKALIQKAITWIYDRKKYSKLSKQQSNDKMLNALYETAHRLETYPRPEEIIINGSKIHFKRSEEEYVIDTHSAVMDLCGTLANNGYLKLIDKNHYRMIGGLAKIDPAGVFVTEYKTFEKDFKNFKEEIVIFANIRSKWIDNKEEPFDVDTMESKLEAIMQHMYGAFDPTVFTNASVTYEQLNSRDVTLVPRDTLDKRSSDIKAASNSLKKQNLRLLVEILKTRINVPSRIVENLSDEFFTKIKIGNQTISNAVMHSQNHSMFGNVIILHSPDLDLINQLHNLIEDNSMIICLIDSEQLPSYISQPFVLHELDTMKIEIEQFKFLHYQQTRKYPTIKHIPDEHTVKIFFCAIKIPLESHMIKEFLDIMEKYVEVV